MSDFRKIVQKLRPGTCIIEEEYNIDNEPMFLYPMERGVSYPCVWKDDWCDTYDGCDKRTKWYGKLTDPDKKEGDEDIYCCANVIRGLLCKRDQFVFLQTTPRQKGGL